MKIAVIGAGLAGLSAALMAHEKRYRVTVYTKGLGGLALSAGTGDLLGYLPDRSDPVVGDPYQAVNDLPQYHPYRLIGTEHLRAGMEWYCQALPGFWAPANPTNTNTFLASALGSVRPTYLVPQTCAAGALRDQMKLLVVGLKQFKDFPATLIADNLNRSERFSLSARAVTLDLSGRGNEADVTATDYARNFDVTDLDPKQAAKLRQKFATLLNDTVQSGETILIPALLGLSPQTFREFQALVNAPVAEVPTVPPSILGRRAYDILVNSCREARVDIHTNCEVMSAASLDGTVTALRVARAGGVDEVEVDAVLDAAGGMTSGNFERDSHLNIQEKVFNLPVFTPAPDATGYLNSIHQIDRENRQELERVLMSGVAVDATMRPVDASGHRLYDNVYCLGEMLGACAPWRELSGEGLALGSAWAAVQSLASLERSRS
ncbi:glycerol-3-phosphate dehydrogenase subunit GlpB [uncultured Mobiluncus sp.]|uniref:glycerol-3-phosphate dehydrogenase subunit GlpB n=1 Tax=uncultured Mobiluncus sp. TaxID=293425 RepID=UPI00288A6E12|nr:glycerol-3-phosphate dehydrogenase subunit GlpB [uncultured Mobiluncus sp.]